MCLRGEIRVATSSLTSVPKPLKMLREHYTNLKEAYTKMVRQYPFTPAPLLPLLSHRRLAGTDS